MSKHSFSSAERFGLWKAHDGRCFWCSLPVIYNEVAIDHIVAESITEDALGEIKIGYGLPDTFDVNSFENWVPAHRMCNEKKGAMVYEPSPAMVHSVAQAGRYAIRARDISEKAKSDRAKGHILGRLAAAAEEGIISEDEVRELFRGLPKPERIVELRIGGLIVVQTMQGLEIVSDGIMVGYRPSGEQIHPSFRCGNCGSLGPWNGSFCMTCRTLDYPD
jgi:hypothetical protein